MHRICFDLRMSLAAGAMAAGTPLGSAEVFFKGKHKAE
jgi:hypothetical protein